jgi:hypothetical protein
MSILPLLLHYACIIKRENKFSKMSINQIIICYYNLLSIYYILLKYFKEMFLYQNEKINFQNDV